VIAGLLSFAGEPGDDDNVLGAVGAVESSTYVTPLEQVETLPAGSVAVALNVVVESSATETPIPAPPKLAALPVAVAAPEQSADV
jgi:hypothetical protein